MSGCSKARIIFSHQRDKDGYGMNKGNVKIRYIVYCQLLTPSTYTHNHATLLRSATIISHTTLSSSLSNSPRPTPGSYRKRRDIIIVVVGIIRTTSCSYTDRRNRTITTSALRMRSKYHGGSACTTPTSLPWRSMMPWRRILRIVSAIASIPTARPLKLRELDISTRQ
jgi:hypothetical protein